MSYMAHGQWTQNVFSGGTDLTPYYFNEADTVHFHETLKAACDEHDLTYYPRYEMKFISFSLKNIYDLIEWFVAVSRNGVINISV